MVKMKTSHQLFDGWFFITESEQNMNKDSWYFCPHGHKTSQRIEKYSNIENTPIWCKHCKKAYYPVVKDGKILEPESSTRADKC